jgi:hypothetical protein
MDSGPAAQKCGFAGKSNGEDDQYCLHVLKKELMNVSI